MAFRILSHAGKITYGLKDYVVDVFEDIKTINTINLATGSTVFVIETSEYYMLNSTREWVKVSLGGRANNYDIIYDGGGIGDINESKEDSDKNDIIYDGGGVD